MKMKKDLTGQRFGRLSVTGFSHRKLTPGGGQSYLWQCLCECGGTVVVDRSNLRSGRALSCGCIRREVQTQRLYIHGQSKTRLSRTWYGIIRRCEDPKYKDYARWGGRGIRVCEEWRLDFMAFRAWALSHGYEEHLCIDRIDNDGNYEPGNCQWITRSANSKKRHEDRRLVGCGS